MLPKKFRLQDFQEIEKVKKEGKLYQSPLFGVLVLPRPDQGNSCFAFILSLKISKKSSKRNRAKRLLSESVRLLLPKIKPGYNLVFLAKKNLIGKNLKQIEVEVANVFKKAGLMAR